MKLVSVNVLIGLSDNITNVTVCRLKSCALLNTQNVYLAGKTDLPTSMEFMDDKLHRHFLFDTHES